MRRVGRRADGGSSQGRLRRTRIDVYRGDPPSQAALAVVRPDDPPVAERFELYVDGIELANGYHELLDAAVLQQRNRDNNRLRQLDGKAPLPEESRLLAAMEAGLSPCTGVALGFDRVVMLASGAATGLNKASAARPARIREIAMGLLRNF